MNPFEDLFKSKRFWTMVLTSLVSFVVSIVPQLENVRGELLTVFLVIGGILVGGYSLEDAAIAFGDAQVKAYAAKSQLVTAQTAQSAQGLSVSQNSQAAAREAYERTKDR